MGQTRRGGCFTGVQRGYGTKVQLEAWRNEWAQKCNGCMASRFTTMCSVLLASECNYKLNDQPVCEQVTTTVDPRLSEPQLSKPLIIRIGFQAQ